MFSLFKKRRIDTSTPLKFKVSILERSVSITDLLDEKTMYSWMRKENSREYMQVLESLAEQGNIPCQEYSAQFYMMAVASAINRDQKKSMYYKGLKFGILAAESGIVRESLNVPVVALKLSGILVDENNGVINVEIKSIVQLSYKWNNLNSNDNRISSADRVRSTKAAQELKDCWPEIAEGQEFGMNDEDKNDREGVIVQIVLKIIMTLGSDAPDARRAGEMAKEALQEISTKEMRELNIDVMAFFVLMKVAISAFDDDEIDLAEMLSRKCIPLGNFLMETPSHDYSDLEFSMIESASESMNRMM